MGWLPYSLSNPLSLRLSALSLPILPIPGLTSTPLSDHRSRRTFFWLTYTPQVLVDSSFNTTTIPHTPHTVNSPVLPLTPLIHPQPKKPSHSRPTADQQPPNPYTARLLTATHSPKIPPPPLTPKKTILLPNIPKISCYNPFPSLETCVILNLVRDNVRKKPMEPLYIAHSNHPFRVI